MVGERNPYVLIDTGEGKDEYIPYLKQALLDDINPHDSTRPYVSDIILTHRHRDHICGLPSVLKLLRKLWDEEHLLPTAPYQPPRLHKIPLPTADVTLDTVISSLEPGTFTPTPSGAPIHDLSDASTIPIVTDAPESTEESASPGPSSSLQIMHTPGHTPDSLCIYHPLDRALFTADTVLGHGTSVFEELGPYMASLRKMLALAGYETVYPGHGPVVREGRAKVATYLQHRVEREEQIVRVLRRPRADGQEGWTTQALVEDIYAKYPRELWGPAAHSVDLHLKKLEAEGRVDKAGDAWLLLN